MRARRFFWFLVSILVGAAAGLAIGWYLHPSPMGEVDPPALRNDYQADYVLMVAEVYDADKDLLTAMQRLKFLGDDPPSRLVQVAIIRAGELSYDRRDLELLAMLSQALMANPGGAAATSVPRGTP